MIKKLTLLFAVFIASLTGALSAQNCQYQLQFFDSFGDGWNGGILTVHLNGVPTDYGFTPTDGDGSFFNIFIDVATGDSISLDFDSGTFPGEESFFILDNDDQLVYESSNPPENGEDIFNFIVECQTCVSPPVASVEFFRLRSTSVDVRWNSISSIENPVYLLEYGLAGFMPGVDAIDLIETMDTTVRVQPLTDTTAYEFYLSILCPTDSMTVDTSLARGPFELFTPLSRDVGISAILGPQSGCELGSEDLRIEIANFGGQPLTFIPFDYSINGIPAGVNMPEDGFFVGVVGAGESEITEFDMQGDFSAPGTYVIEVWTALDGDQDTSNDTLSIEVVSAPFITDLPYTEDFESGSGFFAPVQDGLGENSWAYGTPSGNTIGSAGSGEFSWSTNPSGTHNSNELSYLVSPCFDFTNATSDYVISFLYSRNIAFSDGVFLEFTTDNENWARVGEAGTGINWFNNFPSQFWNGTSNVYLSALQDIGNLAGEPLVRFRFGLTSSPSFELEGFSFDNLYIGPRGTIDLAATDLEIVQFAPCGSTEDLVSISFTNLGQVDATGYTLNYQINGGDIVSEPLVSFLAPGESAVYEFTTLFDGTQADELEIVAWVEIAGDEIAQNDTLNTIIRNTRQLPIYEDFEDGEPIGWELDPSTFIAQDHGSPTTVLYTNLSNTNQTERTVTANYGPIELGDSLAFDYRFVNDNANNTPTQLFGDEVSIFIIENCGDDEDLLGLINAFTHTTSDELARRAFSLDEYAGSDIQIVFDADWFNGDYFFDLDNINIKRCPDSLGIETMVTDASTNGTSDGSVNVAVNDGIAPYRFSWSNGATTQNLTDVPAGDYVLTVSDVQGCTEEVTVRVDFLTSTETEIANFGKVVASPNPTQGRLLLDIELIQTESLQIELLDKLGRQLFLRDMGHVSQVREEIDLGDMSSGIYFARLRAGNQVHTIRVVKVR
ncbi:MAG: T9SS type A sorting domain-containing protein [Bacteroidota bacterium]